MDEDKDTHTLALTNSVYEKKSITTFECVRFYDREYTWIDYPNYDAKIITLTESIVTDNTRHDDDNNNNKWAQPNITNQCANKAPDIKIYLNMLWKIPLSVIAESIEKSIEDDEYDDTNENYQRTFKKNYMDIFRGRSTVFFKNESGTHSMYSISLVELGTNMPIVLWTQQSYCVNNGKKIVYEYKDDMLYPLNPYGRTGIANRGVLGNWGPNFTAEPIITRLSSDRQFLEMIIVKKSTKNSQDIHERTVDPGEKINDLILQELDDTFLTKNKKSKNNVKTDITSLLKKKYIYKGYVDDPRNTDNSWIETSVYHAHIHNSNYLKNVVFKNNGNVSWIKIAEKNGDEFEFVEDYEPEIKEVLPYMHSQYINFIKKAIDNIN